MHLWPAERLKSCRGTKTQGLWKIHPTLPFTQVWGPKEGMGIVMIITTAIFSAGTELKNIQSFQSTLMCSILLESHKNIVKIDLHF